MQGSTIKVKNVVKATMTELKKKRTDKGQIGSSLMCLHCQGMIRETTKCPLLEYQSDPAKRMMIAAQVLHNLIPGEI